MNCIYFLFPLVFSIPVDEVSRPISVPGPIKLLADPDTKNVTLI